MYQPHPRVARSLPVTEPASVVSGGHEPVADYAYVRVLDSGGGMDPETEERAFEPYFSTRGKDRGVGLSTALGIARAHRAPVLFENEYGRGCDVTLLFPLDRDEFDYGERIS